MEERQNNHPQVQTTQSPSMTSIDASQVSSAQSPWGVPGAIVIAGLLIAGALFYGNQDSGKNSDTLKVADTKEAVQEDASLDKINPITEKDHILGNVNASIKIVEYSDTECPFCKNFHTNMQQIMNEYGKNGKVAWVYRQFPLDSLHSKARTEAEATECAAELGGNAKFWAYLDRLMEVTPSNDGLNLAQLPEIAKYVGLNDKAFSKCLSELKYKGHIDSDIENALATGGRGTPWSILIAKDGTKYPISGAQSYATIKALIEKSL